MNSTIVTFRLTSMGSPASVQRKQKRMSATSLMSNFELGRVLLVCSMVATRVPTKVESILATLGTCKLSSKLVNVPKLLHKCHNIFDVSIGLIVASVARWHMLLWYRVPKTDKTVQKDLLCLK